MFRYKINTIYFIFLFTVLLACSENKTKADIKEFSNVPKSIVLTDLKSKGVFVLNKQPLTPDENGIIAQVKIDLPDFQKAIYFRPFTPTSASGNRVEPLWLNDITDLANLKEKKPRGNTHVNLGTFLMLKKPSGNYLVLLPLVSDSVGNTFSIKDSSLCLTVGTYGTRTEHTSAPLLAYAESESPYEAARMVWEIALQTEGVKENINWRSDKNYPEPFKYLGWCSWEHYRLDINEEIILRSIADIKSSTLPFRWLMVDNGYLDVDKWDLLSFGVNKKKFPNGWNNITSQKDDKLKWMGLWRNFNGYMGGVSVNHTMDNLKEHIVRVEHKGKERYMPRISSESSHAFYHEMTSQTKETGFDFLKVDFQSNNLFYNRGSVNAVLGVHYNNTALEENCKSDGLPLLNCIAQQNFNVFNHRYSALIRGSIDYKTSTSSLYLTLVQNFANAFWLGHTHWIDQDMFYANHETAKLMAVARAVSGGPVYLSDETKNIDSTYLLPLTYKDGRILGTLAPGVPLPESLMQDPYFDGSAFRVIAPLENESAIIMAVNLNQDEKKVKSFINLDDYTFAGGMIQPYTGLWDIPKEGILLYDQYAQKASVLKDDYIFELESRKEGLFQLSPIKHGWSVIGRPDKYLSASCYQLLSIDDESIKIKMVEDGPLMLWSISNKPISDNFEFTEMGDGLWYGELVKPAKPANNNEYIIAN